MDPTNPSPQPQNQSPQPADTFPIPSVASSTDESLKQPASTAPSEPAPVSAALSSFNPPVFHNPLSANHTAATQQLPDLPSLSAEVPVNESNPPPVMSVDSQATLPGSTLPTSQSPVTPLNTAAPSPANDPALPANPPSAHSFPAPAPVRLAPEPRADDYHAAMQAQAATASPFGGSVPASAPSLASQPSTPAPQPTRHPPYRMWAAAGIGVLILGVGLWLFRGVFIAPAPPTSSMRPTVNLQRSRTEVPVQPGLQKAETACYAFQVPANPTVNSNSECKVDLVYGEQKVSSIIVSTYRDFDLVTPTEGEEAGEKRFSSEEFLKELITNTTTGKTVIRQESILVGNLPAQKIIVGEVEKPASHVAYVYIVLPESDQQFSEKKFIAFIITGAYNDEYSQKSFDQALKLWYWK